MSRNRWLRRALAGLAWVGLIAAAPATPSYVAVERAIARIEAGWQNLAPEANPHAESWRTLFEAVRRDLRAYATSEDADARLDALRRLYGVAESLGSTAWPAAAELREELRHWLRPRMALAWAEYRTLEAAQAGGDETRDTWRAFVKDTLRPAVLAVESAASVEARSDAMRRVREAVDSVRRAPGGSPLAQSSGLMAAVDDLYNVPNVELILGRDAVASTVLQRGGIVEAGPIFFRGQWSYVTPGPVTGIGFVPTPDGIQVAISQALTSITPIQGFEQQMQAADPRAQRATKLYDFSATTRNDSILTMYVAFRMAGGLTLTPSYQHGVSAQICTTPAPGAGFGRLVASLVGYGQRRITNEVYQGAIGRMREEVVSGAQELGAIRTGEQQARLNAQLAPFLPDSRTIATGEFGLTDVSLETQADFARAAGRLFGPDRNATGASMPQPRSLLTYEPGITADVHLPSALETAIRGAYGDPRIESVRNVVIEPPTPVAGEGAPPAGQPRVETNVEYAAFVAKLDAARAENGSRAPNLLRVKRPEEAPVVSSDASGHLVVLVRDFELDLPAPSAAARGGGITGPPARVYRLRSPMAEFVLDVDVVPDPQGGAPRISAKVADFNPGPRAEVLALNEDETAGRPLNPVTARVILGLFESRLTANPIEAPLATLGQQPVYLRSASALDPSGWMRLVLQPR
jgi:hypothetical protein